MLGTVTASSTSVKGQQVSLVPAKYLVYVIHSSLMSLLKKKKSQLVEVSLLSPSEIEYMSVLQFISSSAEYFPLK